MLILGTNQDVSHFTKSQEGKDHAPRRNGVSRGIIRDSQCTLAVTRERTQLFASFYIP